MALVDKPHFYRIQMDIPESGDLTKSILQVCYDVNIVDSSTNAVVGKKLVNGNPVSGIINIPVRNSVAEIGAEVTKVQQFIINKAATELANPVRLT